MLMLISASFSRDNLMALDIIGGLLLLAFAVVDFMRGAIRVLGGMIALIFAIVMAYFFSSYAEGIISSQFGLNVVSVGSPNVAMFDIPAGYFLGILSTFLICYIPGLFLFPYTLRKIFKSFGRIEEMAMEETKVDAPATPKASDKKGKEKKPEKKPDTGSAASGAEKEVEYVAEEIQISLVERLLGGCLGLIKGTVIVCLFLLLVHVLPTPDWIRDSMGKSFFGKLYDHYIARAIEKQSPEFKIINNMGYLIEIAPKIAEKPEVLEKLKTHKAFEDFQNLRAVRKLAKDEEFVEWAKKQPVTEVLKDSRVKSLLQDPEVKQKIADLDIKEIRNYVRGF
jgi:uncharacterized membrane protein required for colicin V production